ncbi:MAG: hypothetical protein HOV80_33535 [Polyangiaceae bacterium]|nr:hypothetical protein [Polyangiaceae bacterium]
MRLRLVACFALLSACSEGSAPPTAASASASAPAFVPLTPAGLPKTAPSVAKRAAVAPPPEPGPYSPRPDTSAAAPPSAAPAEPPKAIGTHKDWVAKYQGSGVAETNAPPQLGVLSDLPDLQKGAVVFVRSQQLIRIDLPLGRETPLTKGPGSNTRPRFTRDAAWLYFQSNRDGAADRVYRMRPDGTQAEPVTDKLRTGMDTDWDISDDGARVTYIERVDEQGSNALHVVDVATKEDREVYRSVGLSYASFSRDGKSLYFVDGFYETGPDAEHPKSLHRLDLATGKEERLPNGGYTEITQPWDLGDDRLLFAASIDFSMVGRSPRVFSMPAKGGAWSKVGSVEAPVGYVHFEPTLDKKKLALATSMRQGGFGADWVVDINIEPIEGGTARRLTPGFPRPFYSAGSPSWAPDNRHLAFVLTLCPYMGCEPTIRSVVMVDTDAKEPKLAFIGYGGDPVVAPVARALAPAKDAR